MNCLDKVLSSWSLLTRLTQNWHLFSLPPPPQHLVHLVYQSLILAWASSLNLHPIFMLSVSCLPTALNCLSTFSQLSLSFLSIIFQHSLSLPISQLSLRTISGQVLYHSQSMLGSNCQSPTYFVLLRLF